MDRDEIIEALESTAPNRGDRGMIGDPRVPSDADIRLWRDGVIRFLTELDSDLTVAEVIDALDY